MVSSIQRAFQIHLVDLSNFKLNTICFASLGSPLQPYPGLTAVTLDFLINLIKLSCLSIFFGCNVSICKKPNEKRIHPPLFERFFSHSSAHHTKHKSSKLPFSALRQFPESLFERGRQPRQPSPSLQDRKKPFVEIEALELQRILQLVT